MPAPRSRRRARLSALVSVALAFTGFQVFLAPAASAAGSTTIVINEVYGGGGNSGAAFKNDFIELYNVSDEVISLGGKSLQYRAAATLTAPTATNTYSFGGSATINPHDYYLVQCAGGANGSTVPTPDATDCTLNLSGTAGQLILANTTANFVPQTNASAPFTFDSRVIDFVGFGTTAAVYEGAGPTPAPSNPASVSRNGSHLDSDSNSTNFTVTNPPTPTAGQPAQLALANPGNQTSTLGQPVSLQMSASGGTRTYTYTAAELPPGLTISSGGLISGTPNTTTGSPFHVTVTVNDGSTTKDVSFDWTINATATVTPIATLQGTGARSSYAGSGTTQGAESVTTEGVITAVYTKGFGTNGAASCGLCGFYLQTGGTGGGTDATPGAADGIFAYGTPGFTGLDSTGATLAVGQSVRVTGKISEFSVSGDTLGSLTELNYSGAANVVPIAALPAPTALTALPALADREAHEGEIAAPTDLVITDVYNFETSGELGLATGGKPLVQPTEICADDDTVCIAAARADIKNRGWFLDDGSTTAYLTSQTFYTPQSSQNSDIPLPFMDAAHSARVGAAVTFPSGKPGVIGYGNKKWYVYPQRAVQSTPEGTPDLGADVVTIEDTRPANAAPAAVGGDLKIATYNVENFFSMTGQAFAAANPYFTCRSNNDRQGNPLQVDECTSPQAIPSAWDSVTGAPTAYSSGLVSAPRGAWRQADLDRQAAKVVTAINGLGADVVSLEELGNPNKMRTGVTNGPLNPDTEKVDSGLGTPVAWRDETINYLVERLNADAGAGVWSFVASPEESTDATAVAGLCATTQPNGTPVPGPASTAGTCSFASGQDVIRSGFLYKRATVVPVGPSDIDFPTSSAPKPSPFDNAREPLAQFFKPVGHPNADGFAVIVNHFKSKGNSDPAATGGNADSDLTGAFNLARTQQATELLRFANEFADKWDTTKVFLVGDFNSYTKEDPIQAIVNPAPGTDDLDFDVVNSDDPEDLTYVFTATVDTVGYGGAGSLDHVLASADARAAITGTDVWEINSNEAGVYNYGRFNTNATTFFDGTKPFAGSDHNPEIIGIDVAGTPSVRDIQIIGSNDFHGRLLGSSSDGGAAQLTGAVKSLRATYGDANTTFVAAGDLIGASTFESFVQKDKPTLEALNAAGLEVSAVGNHEFDQGYNDLLNRVMKPYDADTNPFGAVGGLNWQYIGSNVVWDEDPDAGGPKQAGDPIVMPTWEKDMGGGIKIGFVGAVTEDLPALVNPAGMNGVHVTPIAQAVNNYAAQLKGDGADLVILLVHEGAPSTDCSTMNTGDSAFAELLGDINPDIDAVISGHTHLEYSCSFPVPEWSAKPIKERPVVSAGQYGVALDQLVYSFDTTSGLPVQVTSNNVGVKGPGSTLFSYPEDLTVKGIVDAAVAASVGPGNVVLGQIEGPFKRARLADTTTENRGGESTLGNLVAEIQRWATPASPGIEPAQIAFMNPGGLRADLNGSGTSFPKDVTYRQAADVQPFANTLVNVDMTGAQIKQVLEQQWQRDAQGNVPSRPFLRLGTSKGFTYTYYETADPDHAGAKLGHVTSMWLDGTRILDGTTYSVTMNSFLASGGDNFRAFMQGLDERDTGVTDLQAQVDYMDANAGDAPLEVDYGQHAVSITFPPAAPATYAPGETVTFDVASLAMTGVDDLRDATIKAVINGTDLGDFPVNNTLTPSSPYDDAGKASVTVTLPAGLTDGTAKLHLIGNQTGTDVIVPITVDDGLTDTTISAGDVSVAKGEAAQVAITVTPSAATGTVTVSDGATELASATLAGGAATVTIPANLVPAIGTHQLTVSYGGAAGSYAPSTSTFILTVTKATPTITAPDVTVPVGETGTASVTVTATGVTPTGTVTLKNGATEIGSGALDNGAVEIDLPVLPDETVVTVDYSGDGNVAAGTTTFTVHKGAKATPTVTVADSSVAYGASEDVSVTVSATGVTPTGTVTIKDGTTTLGSATLSAGAATVSIPAGTLAVGPHTLSVEYSGDDDVNGATTTFTLTVTKATPTITAPDVTVPVGETGTASVTVTASGVTPTGTVTLKNGATVIGSDTLDNGAVEIDLPVLPDGTVVTVDYSGDGNVAAGTTTFTVHKGAKATATVTVADATVPYGIAKAVPVTVSASGTGVTPTGTVTIKDGSTTLGSATLSAGTATVTIPAGSLAVGPHTLSVEYSGDGDVNGATTTFTLTVTKATATVTAPDVTVPVGTTGTASVTVTATGVTPTGTVTLKNGATVIGSGTLTSGQVQIGLPVLPDGTVVTVEYSGDTHVAAGTTTFTVHKGAKATATLAVPATSVLFGSAKAVSVQVTAPGATPTGTVTIKNGATTLGSGTVSGGVATVTLPARSLPAGAHTLSVAYAGDDNVSAAVTTFAVTVAKVTSTIDTQTKPKKPKRGHTVKLKIRVDGANGVEATGEVVVKIGGDKFTVNLANGEVTVKLGTFAKGTYKGKVVYDGDANVDGSTTKVKIKVT